MRRYKQYVVATSEMIHHLSRLHYLLRRMSLVFILMLTVKGIHAQSKAVQPGVGSAFTFYQDVLTSESSALAQLKPTWLIHPNQQIRVTQHVPSLDHLPGLFCRMEYKLETRSRLAPRFRLGSLAYTEWLEGKRERE